MAILPVSARPRRVEINSTPGFLRTYVLTEFQMKIKFLISILLLSASSSYAVSGDEIIEKFMARMADIEVLSGDITWTSSEGGTYRGHFNYMAPDRIHVELKSPGGILIVANGRRLWVYNRRTDICAIQDLGSEKSGGIVALLSEYSAELLTMDDQDHPEELYHIYLQNPEKEYPGITLIADESFLLREAVFEKRDGEIFSFSLSNINTSPNLVRSKFDFSVPASAQTIVNPLDIR